MTKPIVFLFSLIGCCSFGQELSCNDFKEGAFVAKMTEPVQAEWKIVRTGNSQTEFLKEIPELLKETDFSTEPRYGTIEWIDDCTYILTYDATKTELTDEQKVVNKLGGFITEMIKIEDGCFHYKSTLKYDGGEQSIEGKFCKE